MAARILLFVLLISGCAQIESPTRIAMLAPFEGRYREVGYNALYAARLAFADNGAESSEFMPIDDGGTVNSAVDRARALYRDPQVRSVIVLGYAATASETLAEFVDIPVLVVGDWGVESEYDHVFILSPEEIDRLHTIPPRADVITASQLEAPLTGGDVLALDQFEALRPSLDGISIVSAASLPDADFVERYIGSDPFAPHPGLLATLTYDATTIALNAIHNTPNTRAQVSQGMTTSAAQGLNGRIEFDESGYWADASVQIYEYNTVRELALADSVVE